MARVLISSRAAKGEVNPRLGVARLLSRLGHEVTWLQFGDVAPESTRLGIEVVSIPGPAIALSPQQRAEVEDAPEASLRFTRAAFIESSRSALPRVMEIMRSVRPDVLAGQGSLYAPIVAADRLGIPFVNLSANLSSIRPLGFSSPVDERLELLRHEREALFADCAQPPSFRGLECLSQLANIVFATREFIGTDAAVLPTTRLVGPTMAADCRDDPSFPAVDWPRGDGPLVYVSFGSRVSWQPALLRAFAAAGPGVRMVLNASELADGDFVRSLPRNVVAKSFVPQLAMLAECSLFVTHGGANSVMESLYFGVPMIVVPLSNDQPICAHFVRAAKVGVWAEKAELTAERCQQLVEELLTDGDYRERAQAIARSYRQQDGTLGAARAIESVL